MNIRPYKNADQSAVITLWQASGLVTQHNNPALDIQRKLAVDAELFLVGDEDGEIVATVMGGYEGHRGWINYLAVKPDAQRAGLGGQMMQKMEALLLLKGCPKINLQVRSSNAAAVKFYKTMGYCSDDVVSLGKRIIQDFPLLTRQ